MGSEAYISIQAPVFSRDYLKDSIVSGWKGIVYRYLG